MTLNEKICRIISSQVDGDDPDGQLSHFIPGMKNWECHKYPSQKIIEAVFEELREVSDTMAEAGGFPKHYDRSAIRDTWRAMLAEKEREMKSE